MFLGFRWIRVFVWVSNKIDSDVILSYLFLGAKEKNFEGKILIFGFVFSEGCVLCWFFIQEMVLHVMLGEVITKFEYEQWRWGWWKSAKRITW